MRRLLLAVVLLALGACARTPWKPYSGWSVVRTRHITMYTDYGRYKTTLEALEYAYSALHASLFAKRTIAPVEVLFLQADQFLAVLGQYRRGASIAKLPGLGALGRRGVLVLGEESTFPGMPAHRLAHLMLHAMAPRAPLWVHEGYAEFVETIQYRGDDTGNMACLGHLNDADSQIPLRELFGWNWAAYDDSKKADWYRYTARSLVDYFLLAEKGALREKFGQIIAAQMRGKTTAEALAEVMPDVSVEELEKRVSEHRRVSEMTPRGLCPWRFPIRYEEAADMSKPRVEPAAEEDIEGLMTRIMLLPRRAGYVDWYPPEVLTLEGARSAS
jgi:hypothetical protein